LGELGRKIKKIVFIGLSAILLAIGLVFEFNLRWELPANIIFITVAIISGYSIDLLIAIAAVGSFFIGHGEEGAAVILLFYVAEFLEDYAADRARKSIASLMELAPEVATVKREGEEVKVPVSDVNVNEIIVVRPGGEDTFRRRDCWRGFDG